MKDLRARARTALDTHGDRICAGLVLMVLLVGLAYSLVLADRLRYPDERDYLRIADSVCESGVYSRDGGATPTAYRAPGYPLTLAAFRCAGAPILALRMLGFVALAGAAWFVGRAIEKSHGRVARVLVTAGTVFYPLHVYTAATLYPQALAMFGFAVLLDRVAQTAVRRELSLVSAGVVAVVATALVMTVPPMLPAVSVTTLALGIVARIGRRRLLLTAVAISLAVGAWSARNMGALGEPVPFSTNSGYNLALGNSPRTQPSSGLSVDISELRQTARGKPEVERDRVFRNAALGWIKAEPGAAAWLYIRKFAYFFAASNQLATASEQAGRRELLMYLTYGPAALLAVVGLALAAARRRSLSWVEATGALAFLGTAAFYAIFFSRLRFRVPVEPALLALASTYLAELAFGARRLLPSTQRNPPDPERRGDR